MHQPELSQQENFPLLRLQMADQAVPTHRPARQQGSCIRDSCKFDALVHEPLPLAPLHRDELDRR